MLAEVVLNDRAHLGAGEVLHVQLRSRGAGEGAGVVRGRRGAGVLVSTSLRRMALGGRKGGGLAEGVIVCGKKSRGAGAEERLSDW